MKNILPKSIFPLLLTMALVLATIALIINISMEGDGRYIKAAPGPLDPNVRELANLIPRKYEYNRPAYLKLQDSSTDDPTVRRQARELSKVWIHTFYARMNNYTHEFCFVLVDKEQFSIGAVTLAARAFQTKGYKVSISDSGFYYIVEIAE